MCIILKLKRYGEKYTIPKRDNGKGLCHIVKNTVNAYFIFYYVPFSVLKNHNTDK